MTSKFPEKASSKNNGGFQDKDKRRAALLSLLLHALFILLIAFYRTETEPLDTYLVIDVGVPAFAEEETLAPAADAPAPQAAEPLVEADTAGTPQAQTAPEAPPAPAPAPQETPVAETPTETPAETEPQPVAETPPPATEPTPEPEPQVAETPPQEPTPTEPEPQSEPEVAPEPEPQPQVAEVAPPAETELPETPDTAATLPEIDAVEAAPEAQAIALPTPTPQVDVAPAVSVATEATVQVAPEQAVPTPNVQTDVAQSQEIPQPEIETSVAEAAPIPQPEAQTTVAEAQDIPQPQVAASVAEAQAVPTPNAQASVAQAQAVPLPGAQASVTAAQAIPSPSAQASVTAAEAIPQPQAQASVTPAPSDAQGTQASAGTSDSQQATTDSSTSSEGTEGTSGPELPNAVTATANAMGQRAPEDGGNASTSGQTTADPNASADNLGEAASPDGVGEGTGAPFAQVPYRENRDRPLNVMIDNTFGYPQAGLREASMIIEMPVEGGNTRLMTMYDRIDPARVGPVRSARDYFHAISSGMDGILVHDGGSPSAMAAIERASMPTLNAYNNGNLFERGGGEAPYNLFSSGTSLRQAVARLNLNTSRAVSGTIFRPEDSAPAVTRVNVNYSGIYDSGFQYIEDLDQYRWIRNGDNAVDYSGEAVYANAVLVASITAREIPDDTAGRLYIPLESSRATLYVRGKAIEGNWSPNGGVTFTTSLGEVIDLTPFKTWVLFTPTYADITQE
jgi:hypothetical protein